MQLIYKDYVHKSCDDAFFSKMAVLKPNDMRKPHNFSFEFNMKFDIDKIEAQASCFSNEILRNSMLSTIVNKNVQGNPNKKNEVVKDIYIYSYMKAFNMCVTLQETGGEFTGNPGANSTVFKGHSELYKIFYSTFILTLNSGNTSRNTSLYKSLRITDEDITEFRSTEFFDKYNESKMKFFFVNKEFERLLDAFKKFGQMNLAIDEFTDRLIPSPENSPLGNLCLSYSEQDKSDELLIINNSSMLSDMNSKFWNIANCIYLIEGDKNFTRCYSSPYIYADLSSLDDTSIFAQVQSITGLTCGDQFTDYGSKKDKPGDNDPNITGGGNENNPKTPSGRSPKDRDDYKAKGKGDSKPKIKGDDKTKTIINGIKGFGTNSYNTVKGLINDPDVRYMLSLALKQRYEKDGQNEPLYLMPKKTRKTQTTIGNDFIPYKRQVETEEVLNE